MEEKKDIFKVEKEDFIAWLSFSRPEKRNTLNRAFFDGIQKHFQEFSNDDNVRVVIVKAEGKSFSAGIDFNELSTLMKGEGARFRENMSREIRYFQECISSIEKCVKPVIAAVHGHCIGAGLDLICTCDIRIASKDAIFSIRETRMALVADLGTLQRLPLIIGNSYFRELALTGRDFTAEDAYRLGLVTHLCDNQESLYVKAKELAQEISSCPPLAVQCTKEIILYSRDNGIDAGLDFVAQKNATILPSNDVMEALQAFQEKRPPKFNGN